MQEVNDNSLDKIMKEIEKGVDEKAKEIQAYEDEAIKAGFKIIDMLSNKSLVFCMAALEIAKMEIMRQAYKKDFSL